MLSAVPFAFQLDSLSTAFVSLTACLDTSALSDSQVIAQVSHFLGPDENPRLLIPLLCQLAFESNIATPADAPLVLSLDYKAFVQQLQNELVC